MDYTGDNCPFCGRNRVMLGASGYECEKCEQIWGAKCHAKLMMCAEWQYERGVKDALAAAMDACQDGVVSPTIFSDIRALLKEQPG